LASPGLSLPTYLICTRSAGSFIDTIPTTIVKRESPQLYALCLISRRRQSIVSSNMVQPVHKLTSLL
jgi:hypothetical protein